MQRRKNIAGFSLIELVIVVVIIGVIAAIAIPRISRGSEGAAESALAGNLAVLRNALDLFAAEHGGTYPATAGDVADALTQYSDITGTSFSATKTTSAYFGPYLRKVPPLPVGASKGNTGIGAADADGVGWIYDASTGKISANTTDTETDATGTKYNEY